MNVEVEVFSTVVGLLVGRRWFPYEYGGGSVLRRGRFVSGECGGGSVLSRGRFVSGETVVSV